MMIIVIGFVVDSETGSPNLQNRKKMTATLGLVVHAAGRWDSHTTATCISNTDDWQCSSKHWQHKAMARIDLFGCRQE